MSPIFKDLFGLPRPAEKNIDDNLPIVQITETGETIENLLYCATLRSTQELGTLSEGNSLLEAVGKYEISGVRKTMIPFLTEPQFLEQEPLRVYVIACQHGLKAEAIMAAKNTFYRPLLEDTYFSRVDTD